MNDSISFKIPEGYSYDYARSTGQEIVFSKDKKNNSWEKYTFQCKEYTHYTIDCIGNIVPIKYVHPRNCGAVYPTYDLAKAALAFSRLVCIYVRHIGNPILPNEPIILRQDVALYKEDIMDTERFVIINRSHTENTKLFVYSHLSILDNFIHDNRNLIEQSYPFI